MSAGVTTKITTEVAGEIIGKIKLNLNYNNGNP